MPQNFMRLLGSWLALRALGFARSRRSAANPSERTRDADAGAVHRFNQESAMPAEFPRLLLSWAVLLLLGAAEFAVSFMPLGRSLRPLLMIVAMLMAAIVAVSFMEVAKGPTIVRGFAVAAMFWLMVLLGLGSTDPLTRTDYLVPNVQVK